MSRISNTIGIALLLVLVSCSIAVWFYEANLATLITSQYRFTTTYSTNVPIDNIISDHIDVVHNNNVIEYIPKIYMYDIHPSITDVISNWWSGFYRSDSIQSGYSRHIPSANPYLYYTNQFTLEQIIHYKLLHSKYLTVNPDEADLFYVPMFLGTVFRWSRTIKQDKTNAGVCKTETCDDDAYFNTITPIIQDLAVSPYYQHHNGTDHFSIVGRIAWETTRYLKPAGTRGRPTPVSADHPLRLLTENIHIYSIESQSTDPIHWYTLPYPSHMHYINHNGMDVNVNEKPLLAYGTWNNRKPFRKILSNLCESQSKDTCIYYGGGRPYDNVYSTNMYLKSVFCIQPHGDSPTRSSWYDCLQAVSIPVCFDEQIPLPFPGVIDWYNDITIYIPRTDIENNNIDLFAYLRNVSSTEIERRQNNILKYREMLQYSIGTTEQHDAFYYMIQELCQKTQTCSTA